ncbi:tricorn protease [Bryobacterales bacterium F-183]|nr:tricorn protease [Bryobacterales bacterium F-183]
MHRRVLLLALASAGLTILCAQTRLLRQPTYHQGRVVVSYQGDLWSAAENGSDIKRLTSHKSREMMPRFSPDGKWIAFSSNRFGSYDVFVMPAEGGEPRQLTFHSATDNVVGWSRDGKKVIFSSTRGDGVFPTIMSVYEVPAEGGMEQMVPSDWGTYASYSPDGKRMAITRHNPTWWRKHYRGSASGDLWLMDVATGKFTSLNDPEYKGNMLWPMYGAKGEIYFVADRLSNEKNIQFGGPEVLKSTNNIWKISDKGGKAEQVTKHTSGSLFYPSISADGKTVVYEENFGLWKLDTATGKSTEIKLNIVSDTKDNELEWKTLTSSADSFHLSPSTRRAVVSGHGEIFTIATDRGEVQRVTRSFRRDMNPRWSPNGKWIAYVSDESGRDEVWVADEFGKTRKKLTDSDTEKRAMSWAPDSKSLLVSSSDNKLHQVDVEGGAAKLIASSDVSGINSAELSPDGKWVAYVKFDRDSRPHVHIAALDGSVKERRIGEDELFAANQVRWTPDGRKLILTAGVMQQGMASQGRPMSMQLYSVSLLKEDRNPFDRGIDSEEEAMAARGGQQQQGQVKPDVKIDWDGLSKRIRQITRLGDNVAAMTPSPDSRQIAFTTVGGGSSLWIVGENGEGLQRLSQPAAPGAGDSAAPTPPGRGGGGFGGGISAPQFSRDGRTLYFLERDAIYAVNVPAPQNDGPGTNVAARATAAAAGSTAGGPARRRVNFELKVEVDQRAQRQQVFEEGWRIMKHRFYDPQMHGVNWNGMKDTYASLLKYVGDNEELHTLMVQMIGELNASHTGVSGGETNAADRAVAPPRTRYPGFTVEADAASGYYKIKKVFAKGPADKDFTKLGVGDYILALNGEPIKTNESIWKHFTLNTARRWDFAISDKPSAEGSRIVEIEPINEQAQSNLAYDNWVMNRKQMVDKLTNGEIGYLHIRAMDAPSLRKFELDLADNRFKQALIIDQRFNGGGGIDQELLRILQQKQYQTIRRRDSIEQARPQQAYFGPMVVMQNERSASDAEMFPDGFRALGLGKVIGVPTYGGVIGTGSYTLMDGAAIRTPGSGVYTAKGINMENYGVPPDVYVDNPPQETYQGRDLQIEKAIEVLRADLKAKK